MIRGEDPYVIDTFWYDEVNIHPLRFSEKSDGIHNCDVTTTVDDPDEWLLAKDGLDPDDWVLTSLDQGWSPFLQNYGVFPGVDLGHGPGEFKELADAPQTGTWEVEIDEAGIYYFEVQADNQGSITFDGVYLGSTTVFRSHNDSIFFEVNNVTKGTHTIQGTILNASHPSGKQG